MADEERERRLVGFSNHNVGPAVRRALVEAAMRRQHITCIAYTVVANRRANSYAPDHVSRVARKGRVRLVEASGRGEALLACRGGAAAGHEALLREPFAAPAREAGDGEIWREVRRVHSSLERGGVQSKPGLADM